MRIFPLRPERDRIGQEEIKLLLEAYQVFLSLSFLCLLSLFQSLPGFFCLCPFFVFCLCFKAYQFFVFVLYFVFVFVWKPTRSTFSVLCFLPVGKTFVTWRNFQFQYQFFESFPDGLPFFFFVSYCFKVNLRWNLYWVSDGLIKLANKCTNINLASLLVKYAFFFWNVIKMSLLLRLKLLLSHAQLFFYWSKLFFILHPI